MSTVKTLAVRTIRARLRDDRGSSSLELVVLFPVVLAIIFGLIQGALYFHARNVAAAAAREGLRADASYTGSAAGGADAAARFISTAGGNSVITNVTITPARSATQAQVTVRGTAVSVIPGVGGFTVRQSAAGPVERFTR